MSLLRQLGWKFDFAQFDRLEQYTLALSHAHALHRAAHGPKLSLAAIAGELVRDRDILLSDARSLACHQLIKAERLAGCRARPGYRALAYDVLLLVQVLKEAWNVIHDQTPATMAELDHAAVMAERLLRAVGLKDQAARAVAAATVLRRKAFALFMRVYARARAAVQYLRAEVGDADDIAPSLYAGRAKRRKADGRVPQGTPTSSVPGNEPGPARPRSHPSTTQIRVRNDQRLHREWAWPRPRVRLRWTSARHSESCNCSACCPAVAGLRLPRLGRSIADPTSHIAIIAMRGLPAYDWTIPYYPSKGRLGEGD
ncbi:MAG: hypothetical protein JW940_11610 [Polyangiaceae bacterium]|nr:hypothetical protein [Polyangiaceae bacterium]